MFLPAAAVTQLPCGWLQSPHSSTPSSPSGCSSLPSYAASQTKAAIVTVKMKKKKKKKRTFELNFLFKKDLLLRCVRGLAAPNSCVVVNTRSPGKGKCLLMPELRRRQKTSHRTIRIGERNKDLKAFKGRELNAQNATPLRRRSLRTAP